MGAGLGLRLSNPFNRIEMKNKKPTRKRNRCHNCKHAGDRFKIAGKTHMHCLQPAAHTGNAWDTLREFSDTCDKYEAFEIPKEIDQTVRHAATPF